VQRSFAVPLREKCWFGYISSESGGPRLYLFDPLLGARLQRPTSNSTDSAVVDFKFSPDGKFVAYRVKDEADNYALWLWQAPGWDHEQQLNLGGSVTQYAWSNNGKVLATAISSSTGTLLGGVSVAGVPDNETFDGIQGLYELQPVAAPVDSEITWYGNDGYVGFHSLFKRGYAFDIITHAQYGQRGFENVFSRTGDTYSHELRLYPNATGFFVMDPTDYLLDFVGITSDVAVFHGNVAIAPIAPYVALSSNNELEVYRATDDTDMPAVPPRAAAKGCDAILGWAAMQARIACIDETAGIANLYSLDLEGRAAASAPIQGTEAYVGGTWHGHRRLVSPSGNWAVVSNGTDVYMASIGVFAPAVIWTYALGSATEPVDFTFSPNEKLLVMRRASSARIFVTDSNGHGVDLEPGSSTAQNCQDDYLFGADWCGKPATALLPTWSSDSSLVAYVLNDHQLVARDVRTIEHGVTEPVEITSTCGSECIGTGLFQP
jgi:hypothetical protein